MSDVLKDVEERFSLKRKSHADQQEKQEGEREEKREKKRETIKERESKEEEEQIGQDVDQTVSVEIKLKRPEGDYSESIDEFDYGEINIPSPSGSPRNSGEYEEVP